VDQRVADHLADEELSIGDYVLSGGELPALVLIDAVARFLPGVLGDPAAPHNDSFSQGILEAPHFTRPRDFRGWTVPTSSCRGSCRHRRVAQGGRGAPDGAEPPGPAEEKIDRPVAAGIYWQVFFITRNRRQRKDRVWP